MNPTVTLANLAWLGSSLPAWFRYRAALDDPAASQAAVLARYLDRNRDTAIGRELGFTAILAASRRSADPAGDLGERYRAAVPVRGYDEIEPYIGRVASGEPGVLTADAVRRLVPSSGSTAARKLIPFTASLQREFSRAIGAWLVDLHRSHPGLANGRSYWSITPALPRSSDGPVPIGFDDDSEYVGGGRRALARRVLAVPDEVSRISDPAVFRYVTLVFLARARDLRLISVWHPSFLTRLLEALQEWMPRIADDIGHGTVSPPGELDPAVRSALERQLRPDSARAGELRRLSALDAGRIWPELLAVSCWKDALAYHAAERLAGSLPGVAVDGKGLIATEGIVSIPFARRHPLAIRSHFFEFVDSAGRARLAHQLETGAEYSVVLTTGGGLYRYRLGDRIVVNGFVRQTPSIRFVGRDDRISDRCGEKLSEAFVATVLQRLFADRPTPRFAMLAPEAADGGVGYTLFVDADGDPCDLAIRLEHELRRNVHYAWCVDVRQLLPARVAQVGPDADRAYVDACVARGQRLGDVKPAALDAGTDWRAVFERHS